MNDRNVQVYEHFYMEIRGFTGILQDFIQITTNPSFVFFLHIRGLYISLKNSPRFL